MSRLNPVFAVLAALLLASPALAQDGDRRCQPAQIVPGKTDIILWKAGPLHTAEMWFYKDFTGTACLTTFGDHRFVVDWNSLSYGFLHEVGLYDLSVKVDDIPRDRKASHRHRLTHTSGGGGYTGLYGWFGPAGTPEAIEFYINENWSGTDKRVKDMGDTIRLGSISVDGGTYEIFTRPREGNRFAQFWSNRTEPRTSGTISYGEHFAAWRKLGFPNATLTRMTFAFESRWGEPSEGEIAYERFDIDRP